MLNTTLSITILKKDPYVTAVVVVTHPRFDMLSKVERWFKDHTLHIKTKDYFTESERHVYRTFHVDFMNQEQVDEFIVFGDKLCPVYALHAGYSEDVVVVRSPTDSWFVVGKPLPEEGAVLKLD